jgi:hypothetical protein
MLKGQSPPLFLSLKPGKIMFGFTKPIALLAIAACFALHAKAQTINVTGTVIDSSTLTGISGALVRLAEYPSTTTTSTATGSFTLTSNAVHAATPAAGTAAANVTLRGSTMIVVAPGNADRIEAKVFTCNGALVYSAERPVGVAGTAVFDHTQSSSQLYYIQIRAGSCEYRFTTFGMPGMSHPVTLSGGPVLAKSASTYNLQVSASGYIPNQIALTSLIANAGTIKLRPLPPPGNPAGTCAIPADATAADVSKPKTVVGTGTPESCTPKAFIDAVAKGGIITFNSGKIPVTITLDRPAKVFNDADSIVVIDGGGLVTLSGGGVSRILYMNTCDSNQHWTTSHCQDQATPRLTVQNLTFINGNSRSEFTYDGGGAIWIRGGRFKVVNCCFFNNTCDSIGPDVGGAAIRVFSQYQGLPVYVVNSTFGGDPALANRGSNGGGVSSIGVSWTLINCLFSYNQAIGNGGNPASSGTPGGGSGGAIYNDGNTMTLSLCGCLLAYNQVNAFGSAIFLVSNDHTGTLNIENSVIRNNTGGSWYTLPGISMFPDTKQNIVNSTIQ